MGLISLPRRSPAERTQPLTPIDHRPIPTLTTTNVHINTDTQVHAERLSDGAITLRVVDPVTGYTGVSVLTDDDGVLRIIAALRNVYDQAGA